jgi:hypothetical protein
VAEAHQPQIDLAQAVEEQQPRTDHVVLELAAHELQGRQGRHLQQPSA